MSVQKRKTRSGGIVWEYQFDAPGSKPGSRERITKRGFATKKAAVEAEATRRTEAAREHEAKKRQRQTIPKTLGELLLEFVADSEKTRRIEPTTLHRYRAMIPYISEELAGMELRAVQPLLLHREWQRLRDSGGRGRRAGKPLSLKTVRNTVGLVSAAYSKAILWGLAEINPVENSEPPRLQRTEAQSISYETQQQLIQSSTHPVVPLLLEIASATAARRGEILALRWADIVDGRVIIARALCQSGPKIYFKDYPKGRKMRMVSLPPSTLVVLEAHRELQGEMRRQFAADYQDQDLILCEPNGQPLKPNSISSSVSTLCRRLKMPRGVSLHTMRHSSATQLLADGLEITAVSARLGHANTSTTLDVYGHAIRSRDDEAARLIEEARRRNASATPRQENTALKSNKESIRSTENE